MKGQRNEKLQCRGQGQGNKAVAVIHCSSLGTSQQCSCSDTDKRDKEGARIIKVKSNKREINISEVTTAVALALFSSR